MVPTVRPPKQKDKLKSQETQNRLPRINLLPSLRKKNNDDIYYRLQRCNEQEICSTGSNCKPRSLQRCITKFTRQHSTLFPSDEATGNCFFLQDNARPHTALSLKVFVSISNHSTASYATFFPYSSPSDFFYSHD